MDDMNIIYGCGEVFYNNKGMMGMYGCVGAGELFTNHHSFLPGNTVLLVTKYDHQLSPLMSDNK